MQVLIRFIIFVGVAGVVTFFSKKHKQAEYRLRKRIKEQQALYGLAEIIEREGITPNKLYQELTNILPRSWQYAEIACVRIVIGNSEFRTKNFIIFAWMQSAPIKVN